MSLTYYEGPSGGVGGSIIDPRDMAHRPEQEDYPVPNTIPQDTLDNLFKTKDDCRIREIIIGLDMSLYVSFLVVSYVGANDIPFGTYKMGSEASAGIKTIQLQEGEFITEVSGHIQMAGPNLIVTGLRITMNSGYQSDSGYTTGVPFDYIAPDGFEIIGFWGAAGANIDRLGVVMKKRP